jgi:hypothetical protein
LREEHRLRVFEKRVLRIFGPKREEDGSWRKLHNDELHSLYSSPNIVRVIKSGRAKWVGHVARMVRGKVFIGFWLGGQEEKRPLGRPRHSWEDNIKMDHREIGIDGRMDSAGSGYGPVVGLCEHVNEPSDFIRRTGYCLTSCVTISFSKNILHHGVSK